MFSCRCSRCDTKLKVEENWAGRRARCPRCGQEFRVTLPPAPPGILASTEPGPAVAVNSGQGPTALWEPAAEDDVRGLVRPASVTAGSPRTPYPFLSPPRGPDELGWLGRYRVLRVLGSGGMGVVFQAEDSLGRLVALKVIRNERLAHPEALRRFHREVRAAAQMSHPNVVFAHDAGQVGGTPFFVMEYVEGTDLARLIKERGPLPVAEACEYARQAALGLQHAHECGLVHRDIKPSNLLLASKGVVKVLDLGLARLNGTDDVGASTALTQEGAVVGTPDFMAPEQILDSHTADIRADLYSLGCTLYFLLTGRAPFVGGSLGEKLLKHQLHHPEPVERLRPEVPPGVAAVVGRLMAKHPQDRYPTPVAVAVALAPWAELGILPPEDEVLRLSPTRGQFAGGPGLSPSGYPLQAGETFIVFGKLHYSQAENCYRLVGTVGGVTTKTSCLREIQPVGGNYYRFITKSGTCYVCELTSAQIQQWLTAEFRGAQ